MALISRPEFSELEEILFKKLEETIEERKELGLSTPETYHTILNYSNGERAIAKALNSDQGPVIQINIIPSVLHLLNPEEKEKADAIRTYLDLLQKFTGNYIEDQILPLLDDTEERIKEYESKLEPNFLEQTKVFFDERGVSYDNHRKFIINNAEKIKELLNELLPSLTSAFEKIDFSFLRHEMDHADFFASPLYLQHKKILDNAYALKQKFHIEKDMTIQEQYAQANMDVLESMSKFVTLLETRAFFFNYVNLGEWNEIDLNIVSEKVYSHFNEHYIKNSLMIDVLDKLVSKSWSKDEMDRQTSNYLFFIINGYTKNPNALSYNFDVNLVNNDVAVKILTEIEEWQDVFRENAKKAVKAIGNAYKNNPRKLSEANKATTFEEYIQLCSC